MAEPLTPYDTGTIAEPILWQDNRDAVQAALRSGHEADIGKVDFNDDEGATVVTVRVTRDKHGAHSIYIESHRDDLRVITTKTIEAPERNKA